VSQIGSDGVVRLPYLMVADLDGEDQIGRMWQAFLSFWCGSADAIALATG
jgi:hypothetical protein